MSAAATDKSWMPTTGRHQVNIGSSLGRALKARKGAAPPPKRSNLPTHDFYSFRYKFKPESIDPAKPGTVEVKKGKEAGSATSIRMDRPSLQNGETHVFVGNEQPAKEWDCVLIYDFDTGLFTMEKIDSFVGLTYDRRVTGKPSPPPAASAEPSPPSSSKEMISRRDLEAELERDLLASMADDDVDADGEPDNEEGEIIPTISHAKAEEEEEQPTIDEKIAPKTTLPPRPNSSKKGKDKAPPPPAKSKGGKVKGKGKGKRSDIASDVEEEDLEFGRPAQPAKRLRPSPPAASHGLALPTGAPTHIPPIRQVDLPIPPPPRAPSLSESEDEWDEVPAVSIPVSVAQSDGEIPDGDGEEEEIDIDMNAFEAEMNQQLVEASDAEEDFLAAAVSPEPARTGRPMSLNQFAGGVGAEASQDDDDFSSSEESDDD